MNYLQSSNFPIQLSFDGGATFKELTCITNWGSDLSLGTTETETLKCGTLLGTGSPKFDWTGEGVTDFVPDAQQVSLKDLEIALLAVQPLIARVTYPGSGSAGATYFKEGTVYCTKAAAKASPNNLIMFDFELKGSGIPKVIAP
jgi:hypothetical protein